MIREILAATGLTLLAINGCAPSAAAEKPQPGSLQYSFSENDFRWAILLQDPELQGGFLRMYTNSEPIVDSSNLMIAEQVYCPANPINKVRGTNTSGTDRGILQEHGCYSYSPRVSLVGSKVAMIVDISQSRRDR